MLQGAILEGPLRSGAYALVRRGVVDPVYLQDIPGVRELRDGVLSIPRNLVPDVGELPKLPTMTPSGKLTLRQYQLEALAFAADLGRKGALLALDVGLGKLQPLDAKVATPTGWTTIGALRVGQEVLTPSGTERVQAFSAVQDVPVYRITFNDGAQTECSLDHAWLVQTTNYRKRGQLGVVMTLRELLADWTWKNGNTKWYTPEYEAVERAEANLPIDPWLLGALLGDGGFSQTTLTFTNSEEDICARAQEALQAIGVTWRETAPGNYALKCAGNLRTQLARLDLLGKLSGEKHIPAEYLYSSIEQRLELLRGLLDTDGDISADGSCVTFNTSSPRLRDGVIELVRSLAGEANQQDKPEPRYTYKGEDRVGQPAYRVAINLPEYRPVSSNKHLDRWRLFTKRRPARGFKSVEYVGHKPCQCIQVSGSKGLYFTDDYIITHNTLVALQLIYALNLRPFVVLAPKQARPTWCREDADPRKHYGFNVWAAQGRTPPESTPTAHGYFVHYEILSPQWEAWVRALNPKCIICDESHILRNITDRTTRIFSLTTHWSVEKRLMLTATPIVNKLMDLWMPLHIAEPGGWGKRFEFGIRYAGFIQGEYGWMETGETYGTELRRRLERSMVALSRHDVRDELPPMERRRVLIPQDALPEEPMREYRKVAVETKKWMAEGNRTIQGIDLQKYTALAASLSTAKGAVAPEQVEELLLRHDKVLVLCWYEETAAQLAEALAARTGAPTFLTTGKTTDKKRQRQLAALAAVKGKAVYVATLGTTQMSINQLVCCSALLFVDLYWLPAALLQAEGRLHREGQDRDVEVVYMLVENSMDDVMYKALRRKADVAARLSADNDGTPLIESLGSGSDKTALVEMLAQLPTDEEWEL